jgi:hypothetical protein
MEAEKYYSKKWNIPIKDKDGYLVEYKHNPIEMIRFAESFAAQEVKKALEYHNAGKFTQGFKAGKALTLKEVLPEFIKSFENQKWNGGETSVIIYSIQYLKTKKQ